VGIISSGVFFDCDPAQVLLGEYASDNSKPAPQVGSILGYGLKAS